MNYTKKRLSDMIIFSNGKSIKPGGEGEFPVYGSNGIIGYGDQPREKNGVIIGRVGAYCGSVAYCPDRFWASDNTIVAYSKTDAYDVRFIYYLLKDLNLNRWAGGAAQPLLTHNVLNQIEAVSPFTHIQRKISTILSAYDDLIENNTRRIQILEQMAQALYREWFVHFRFPGHEKVKLVESPLSKIPQGWAVTNLSAIADKTSNKFVESKHSGLPLLDLARIPRRSCAISELGSSEEISTSRILFEKNEILFGAIRPYFHKVIFAPLRGVTNTSVFVICPKQRATTAFLFNLLFSDEVVQWASQNSGGTKMPVISWDVFSKMKVILPSSFLLGLFDETCIPILELISSLVHKNIILRRTRDILLPKLISGELSVDNVEANP